MSGIPEVTLIIAVRITGQNSGNSKGQNLRGTSPLGPLPTPVGLVVAFGLQAASLGLLLAVVVAVAPVARGVVQHIAFDSSQHSIAAVEIESPGIIKPWTRCEGNSFFSNILGGGIASIFTYCQDYKPSYHWDQTDRPIWNRRLLYFETCTLKCVIPRDFDGLSVDCLGSMTGEANQYIIPNRPTNMGSRHLLGDPNQE
ncbi:hypothetical protein FF38_03385 [Lucilia cuprina]|uniref:Uncharacterized protein n=1 Tax=Lucilia cuprina TaxID=7375 RepID=A0A0L0C034_LUCCU|nr:hypothetical protein FF38_03385 [Lucilia cuprina]